MQIQLKVLTRQSRNSDLYSARYIYGRPLRSTRVRSMVDGADLPFGDTEFEVPSGTVAIGRVIQLKGQNFRAVGISPIAPWFTRDRIETEQMQGIILEAPLTLALIAVDGDTVSVGGNAIGVN